MTPTVREVALTILEGLSCPRAVSVAILVRHGEWDQIATMATDPHSYPDAHSYRLAVQASDLLRKAKDLDTKVDKDAVTLASWWSSERSCYRSNERLSPFIYGSYEPGDERLLEFFDRARKKVRDLIGEAPPDLNGRFGPGATMSDRSTSVTISDKMSSVPTFTPSAIGYLFPFAGTAWGRATATDGRCPRSVRGNAYFTVPKDGSKHRACGKEPSLNVFYQLALGRAMKARLRSNGIDLYDGQDLHRALARVASLSGCYSTIDLSSASDTICYNLVKLLLPPKWFSHLDALRSPFTHVSGKWVLLEKFSSMGNGFTFELETTIFAALACASDSSLVPGVNLWVYGDDIIVKTDSTPEVLAALRYCGFATNPKKTFTEGPFRESCGGDFYMGADVRPVMIQEFPHDPASWIRLANLVDRIWENTSSRTCPTLRRAWFKCLDNLPSTVRNIFGPKDLGDSVLTSPDPERWTLRRRNGILYCKVYRSLGARRVSFEGYSYAVQYASALYLAGTSSESPAWSRVRPGDLVPGRIQTLLNPYGLPLRGTVFGYKVGWTAIG